MYNNDKIIQMTSLPYSLCKLSINVFSTFQLVMWTTEIYEITLKETGEHYIELKLVYLSTIFNLCSGQEACNEATQKRSFPPPSMPAPPPPS